MESLLPFTYSTFLPTWTELDDSSSTEDSVSEQCVTGPETRVGQHGSSGAGGAPDVATTTSTVEQQLFQMAKEIDAIQHAALEVYTINIARIW